MADKKWRFRDDVLGNYINGVSSRTFQDAEDRLNYLEEKNQLPDMREKVRKYISELDVEIDRCEQETVNHSASKIDYMRYMVRLETLVQVQSDLRNRLEELV